MRHEGLEEMEGHLERTGSCLALAVVTLGLYVAASQLLLHSAGPRMLDELPLLALLGNALALWLPLRLVQANPLLWAASGRGDAGYRSRGPGQRGLNGMASGKELGTIMGATVSQDDPNKVQRCQAREEAEE